MSRAVFHFLTAFFFLSQGIHAAAAHFPAHGTGGLLLIRDHPAAASHFVCSDGNGNVTTLASATTGEITATYGYSPFGELIRATGSYAAANPFRFSTRPQDSETALLDYGLRHYKPEWGRWLSRDPLGNIDGYNLYGFAGNDPINRYDIGGGFDAAWWGTFLSPKVAMETFGESVTDPDYYRQVGKNFQDVGQGVVNGAKSAVDGIRSLPEIADFLASGEAADLLDQLLNDPAFREKVAERMGEDFCDFYKRLQTQEGAFQTYGEAAFGALSGAGALKLIKALKAAKAAGKFAKASKKVEAATNVAEGGGGHIPRNRAEFEIEPMQNHGMQTRDGRILEGGTVKSRTDYVDGVPQRRVDLDHSHGDLDRGHVNDLHVNPNNPSQVNTSKPRAPEPGEYLSPVLSDPRIQGGVFRP